MSYCVQSVSSAISQQCSAPTGQQAVPLRRRRSYGSPHQARMAQGQSSKGSLRPGQVFQMEHVIVPSWNPPGSVCNPSYAPCKGKSISNSPLSCRSPRSPVFEFEERCFCLSTPALYTKFVPITVQYQNHFAKKFGGLEEMAYLCRGNRNIQ